MTERGSRPVPDPTVLTTEALVREISALRTLIDQRISASEKLFETKIALGREGGMALKELTESKIDALEKMLGERYQTQTKALDAAFVAQQAAVATSFQASEKAVAAALLAAEKAVDKANTANEKRFESVNEFRAQLNDMVNSLLPSNEAEARFKAIDDKVVDMKSLIDKGFASAETGHERGQEMWGYIIGVAGLIALALTAVFTLVHH
jgi:hypothetical protein